MGESPNANRLFAAWLVYSETFLDERLAFEFLYPSAQLTIELPAMKFLTELSLYFVEGAWW